MTRAVVLLAVLVFASIASGGVDLYVAVGDGTHGITPSAKLKNTPYNFIGNGPAVPPVGDFLGVAPFSSQPFSLAPGTYDIYVYGRFSGEDIVTYGNIVGMHLHAYATGEITITSSRYYLHHKTSGSGSQQYTRWDNTDPVDFHTSSVEGGVVMAILASGIIRQPVGQPHYVYDIYDANTEEFLIGMMQVTVVGPGDLYLGLGSLGLVGRPTPGVDLVAYDVTLNGTTLQTAGQTPSGPTYALLTGKCGLSGVVLEVDRYGRAIGPVGGALVSLASGGSATTSASGEFSFTSVASGTTTLTASKAGYFPANRTVHLVPGQTRHEVVQLLSQAGLQGPAAFGVQAPDGRHVIENVPGSLTFSATVAWNGAPGSVFFRAAGPRYPANITDLGGGLARATVTIPAPAIISACGQLRIEVENGDGQQGLYSPDVHFYPMPDIIKPWFQENIPWALSGPTLSFSREDSVEWRLQVPGRDPAVEAYLGYEGALSYDLFGGTFEGSVGGFGGIEWDWEVSQIEILGEARLDLGGSLTVVLAGCDRAAVVTPSWEASLSGKAGVGAPAVLIVDVLFPPASSTVHWLLSKPYIGDVIGALKLRLYLIGSADIRGEYDGFAGGECFLGTSTLDVSGTIGLEGQIALEARGAEARIYAGGTGTPEFSVCPDWSFDSVTLRAYLGFYASAWLFEYSKEIGAEVTFGDGRYLSRAVPLDDAPFVGEWTPIGTDASRWGASNVLVAGQDRRRLRSDTLLASGGSLEELLVENVTGVSAPSVVARSSTTHIVYALYDPNKPWHISTDIGSLRSVSGGPWILGRIADDGVSDFAPAIERSDVLTDLAAWEQVDGDVSDAEGPEGVAPHLEIAASWFDLSTQQWTTPVLLVDNDVVDRMPVPAVFGTSQGVLWVQNEGDASPGHALLGDRLMYAEWAGSAWGLPQVLWSAPKGILDVAFVGDAVGEGHVVFAVDEDGDLETRADRELYWLASVAGVWQQPVRLTNDAIEDALPVLVAPDGMPICVWGSDGTVVYSELNAWNPVPIYLEYTLANEAPSLEGVTMPGGAAIAYTVQGPHGVDIVAAFYDAALDTWSLPRQLTQDEHVESAVSLACDDSELVVAYLKTQTARNDIDIEIDGVIHHLENVPQPARTDLYVLRHALGHDLAVRAESIVLEPANPEPGTVAMIRATIENRGDLVAENVDVAFYDGDPLDDGLLIGGMQTLAGRFIAGAAQEASVTWSVPREPISHDIFVVVDPALAFDDRDRLNNTTTRAAVLPDPLIETGWSDPVTAYSVILTARVINTGAIPTGSFEVAWHVDAVDGPEIGRATVDSLEVDGAYEATVVWNTQGLPPDQFVEVFAIVDDIDAISEFDETNNQHVQSVRIPLPKVGDCNCDGQVDFFDIDAFLVALGGEAAYYARYPDCYWLAADCDEDGDVDFFDIDGFLDRLGS